MQPLGLSVVFGGKVDQNSIRRGKSVKTLRLEREDFGQSSPSDHVGIPLGVHEWTQFCPTAKYAPDSFRPLVHAVPFIMCVRRGSRDHLVCRVERVVRGARSVSDFANTAVVSPAKGSCSPAQYALAIAPVLLRNLQPVFTAGLYPVGAAGRHIKRHRLQVMFHVLSYKFQCHAVVWTDFPPSPVPRPLL